MSFGGQNPTIIVLKEGLNFWNIELLYIRENWSWLFMIYFFRNWCLTRTGTDNIQHKRLLSCPGYDKEHLGTIWRWFVTRWCQWKTDNYKWWCYSYEGTFYTPRENKSHFSYIIFHRRHILVHNTTSSCYLMIKFWYISPRYIWADKTSPLFFPLWK